MADHKSAFVATFRASGYDEKWLQKLIYDQPSILGLGATDWLALPRPMHHPLQMGWQPLRPVRKRSPGPGCSPTRAATATPAARRSPSPIPILPCSSVQTTKRCSAPPLG